MNRNFSHQFDFAMVPQIDIPRSTFDLTHTHTTTFDCDYIIPIYADEVLPGDTFELSVAAAIRTLTMRTPIMDNLWIETAFFYVPDRLLYDNFTRLMGEKPNPDSSIDFLLPILSFESETVTYNCTHSIYDYLGIPVGTYVAGDTTRYYPKNVRAAWCRAYYDIWNTWFRNQNVQPSLTVPRGAGPDNADYYELQRVNKIADYFTRMLPEPQEGDGIMLPLGVSAPVIGDGSALNFVAASPTSGYGPFQITTTPSLSALAMFATPTGGPSGAVTIGAPVLSQVNYMTYGSRAVGFPTDGPSHAIVDLSAATAATVNQLREAFAMQRVLERLARGGHRYIELVRSLYSVVCPDYRVQQPEYLGGTRDIINISTIVATASTSGAQNLGDLAGIGSCSFHKPGFRKSFVEHGIILGLAWVRGEARYDRGISKMFTRRGRFDIYMPPMAHLGEQPVIRQELYARGTESDDEVIGYNEAWLEYKYKPNRLSGLMRNNCYDEDNASVAGLNTWHIAQDMSYEMADLSPAFIESNTPMDRVCLLPDQPHFKADFKFNIRATRPIPARCVPGLIDHL